MAWNEDLPEWNAPGTEPPLQKKNDGWQPEERPPAGWFNWLLNRAYKCLDEIRTRIETAEGNIFSGNYNDLSGVPSEFPPEAHGSAHESGGADEINLEDLEGESAALKTHLSEEASQTNLGHVKVDGETITASNGVISAQTQIVDTVTTDKWEWGMEDGVVFLEKVVS